MCGLIAVISKNHIQAQQFNSAMKRLSRRGPDASGTIVTDHVFLGHQRLAILDLASRAEQPMQSVCGRYFIVFNGEIYNFKKLRLELEAKGINFQTNSDTEVILTLFIMYGENILHQLHGMFAFVIWDKKEDVFFAARDSYGIKPLYFSDFGSGIIFSSQVKAILDTGLVNRDPNIIGQAGFWMLGSIPEPHTWYKNIQSVKAGHYIWVNNFKIKTERCWFDITSVWREMAQQKITPLSNNDIQKQIRDSVIESINRHLVSDVPIGIFLSGGIDSGALAGLAKELGASKLTGITISYDEFLGKHNDEIPVAKQVANYYDIKHHEYRVTFKDFQNDLPNILEAMDQPSIDGVNTWYASKAAAEIGLKVVLSGVGGDELFFGYKSFRQLPRLVKYWGKLRKIPGIDLLFSLLFAAKAKYTSNNRWKFTTKWLKNISGAWWLRHSTLSPDEVKLFSGINLDSSTFEFSPENWIYQMSGPLANSDIIALAQIESTTYLRNQLLRDCDWASMYHGIELRTPLVDMNLLINLKKCIPYFESINGKKMLGYAPSRALPNSIVNRRKTGFGIPVEEWISRINSKSPSKKNRNFWLQYVGVNYDIG